MRFIFYILALLPITSFAQESKIDSLKFVDDMPYICRDVIENGDSFNPGCGSKIYWDVVMLKKAALPLLLEKIDDSTSTEVSVPYFGYTYTVADIAYVAICEIIHGIPTFDLLPVNFDTNGCGYCSYWQHLNTDYQNRKDFQKALQYWCDSNKDNLVWVESNYFSSCDCSGIHPNKGHYELNKD